jgi:hypothetical protein
VDHDVLSEIRQKCCLSASRVALVDLGGVGLVTNQSSAMRVLTVLLVNLNLRSNTDIRCETNHQKPWYSVSAQAGTTVRFEEGYNRISEIVKIDCRDKTSGDILQLVSKWLCDEINGRWFMIVEQRRRSRCPFEVNRRLWFN